MSQYDPLDLKGQERAQEDRELRERLERENEGEDIKWLMSDKRGRRVLWRLMEEAGVFRSSFNTNAMAMAFAEGNRNYGLRILSLIHATCPRQYPVMMKENTNERTNNDGSANNQ
ncbi:hypothetical protein UFOVP824_5 [uncultured Caudovirales phage]|uniref:Bbp19-like phage domain-containing protein n=1 Tax=uncultured Caudovirales phage TaxID=2100421 RepID=A0A6J5P792_9CAUD|nr:hypothetical protein UFOVP824_5 [uncultured Caudovirales phage]